MITKLRLVIKDTESNLVINEYIDLLDIIAGDSVKVLKDLYTHQKYSIITFDKCIGVLDSEGTDIYTGDIIEFIDGTVKTIMEVPGGYAVEHYKKDFKKSIKVQFLGTYDIISNTYVEKLHKNSKVIGSIHGGVVRAK
jgi:hypothetical protein